MLVRFAVLGWTIVHLERFFEFGTEISFYFEHKHDEFFHSPPQADAKTASVSSVFSVVNNILREHSLP